MHLSGVKHVTAIMWCVEVTLPPATFPRLHFIHRTTLIGPPPFTTLMTPSPTHRYLLGKTAVLRSEVTAAMESVDAVRLNMSRV